MSIPTIRGFTEPPSGHSLAASWTRPDGIPDARWPKKALQAITPAPTEWLTVSSHYSADDGHGGVRTVLVPAEDSPQYLEDTSWLGQDLGR